MILLHADSLDLTTNRSTKQAKMAQPMHSTTMPDIDVCQINAGDGDGAAIIFNYGNRRISVSVFPNPTAAGSIEGRLIDLCGRAVSADDDEYEETVDEILEVIISAGKDAFDKIITQPESTLFASQSLHSALYPQTFAFCLKAAASDNLSVVAINPEDAYASIEEGPTDDLDADFDIDSNLPVYPSDKVVILESLLGGGGSAVGRVLLQGNEMLCKAQARGLRDPRLEKELAAHHKIQATSADATVSVRVPRLLGYISHAQNGSIIGLLREWILGEILRHLDMATVPATTRGKWASQIHETVRQLHNIGVVWGDGKPSNVVIDKQQNAWLIDFGGGWTEGWVDEELADSVEGDDQALVRIFEFLGV